MYRWNPADYHQNSSMQAEFAHGLMAHLRLSGAERVLDLGCGDGKLSASVASRVPYGSVVGIDISPEMIGFARHNFSGAQYSNLSFEVADASHLCFADEFDWVVSFSTLHWIRDHRPVLAGIARALRIEGHALLEFGGQGNGGPLFEVAHEILSAPRWREYFRHFTFPWRFYTGVEYKSLVCAAGLVPERVELVLREAAHQGRAGFAGWMRTTWIPFLRHLPEDLRSEFVSDVIERYLTVRPIGTDGMVRVPMVRLEVEAHKP